MQCINLPISNLGTVNEKQDCLSCKRCHAKQPLCRLSGRAAVEYGARVGPMKLAQDATCHRRPSCSGIAVQIDVDCTFAFPRKLPLTLQPDPFIPVNIHVKAE